MSDEIPEGIDRRQWQYYQEGCKAHAAGEPKDSAMRIHWVPSRAWFLAGWHDSDMEQKAIDTQAIRAFT